MTEKKTTKKKPVMKKTSDLTEKQVLTRLLDDHIEMNDTLEKLLLEVEQNFDANNTANETLVELLDATKQMMQQREETKKLFTQILDNFKTAGMRFDKITQEYSELEKQSTSLCESYDEQSEVIKKNLEKILSNTSETKKLVIENEEAIKGLSEKVTWIDNLIKPIAIIVIAFALLFAFHSMKGCDFIPNPNPSPNPQPGPNPAPDEDTQKAIAICNEANGMNQTHTYNQRIVWATQQIVQQIGWDTDKAVKFATEYVTNF